MGYGKTSFESICRAGRTAYVMAIMLGSLMVSSTPWLISLGDVLFPCVLLSAFTCCTSCFSFRIDWANYSFRSSLIDVPFLSLVRSLVAICAYAVCDIPSFCHAPYFGTTVVCGFFSGVLIVAKACVILLSTSSQSPVAVYVEEQEHFISVWGLPLMFLSSLMLAVGHVTVAYKARCRAIRRLFFCRRDEETVIGRKPVTHAFRRQSRSASPRFFSKLSKDPDRLSKNDEDDVPASLLADPDSLFMQCKGLLVHYKQYNLFIRNVKANECSINLGKGFNHYSSENFLLSSNQKHPSKAQSNGYGNDSLHLPLLTNSCLNEMHHTSSYDSLCRLTSQSSLNGWPAIARTILGKKFEVSNISERDTLSSLPDPASSESKSELPQSSCNARGVIFIHGFGGGVFSWRHIMGPLAQQSGCTVAGLDRPGWGLTSRPTREEWEKKGLPNPYELQSQVDLILAFCLELGLKSVVLVGHDDGGILALMTAAKASQTKHDLQVVIKGVVLVGVSLCREVVPVFARVLLHTTLGRHMLRPLLRSEIGQVANRRAWHDSSKLTAEVLNLYKVPLRVEGWDRALAEVAKPSASGALTSSHVQELLRLVGNLPTLLITGLQDKLVPVDAAQALASQLSQSTIVTIPACGHLPPEECPGALFSAVLPFISSLLDMPVRSDLDKERFHFCNL